MDGAGPVTVASLWSTLAARLRLVVCIVATSLAACFGGGDQPAALSSLKAESLVAGQGLGELRLGATQLRTFLQRFASKRRGLVVGDDVGFEISFVDREISALFLAHEACREQLRSRERDAAELFFKDEGSLFAAFPDCASARLHSIMVQAQDDSSGGYFVGATELGIALGSSREAMQAAYGAGDDRVQGLAILAGSAQSDNRLDQHMFSKGIAFFIGDAPDGSQKGHLVVRKIAIFPPG